MAAMSDYLEAKWIAAVLQGANYTSPLVSDLHLALFTADPTDANNTANEVAATWYARQPTGTWSSPVGGDGVTSNDATITFAAVTDATVVVTHWGIYDALTGGDLQLHAALTASKTLDPGDVLAFAPGSLQITAS